MPLSLRVTRRDTTIPAPAESPAKMTVLESCSLRKGEVCSKAVVEAARKWELGCKPIPRGKHPGLELPCMPLQLVSMCVDTPKKISTSVDVEHHPVSCAAVFLPLLMVPSHLNPFRLEAASSAFAIATTCFHQSS